MTRSNVLNFFAEVAYPYSFRRFLGQVVFGWKRTATFDRVKLSVMTKAGAFWARFCPSSSSDSVVGARFKMVQPVIDVRGLKRSFMVPDPFAPRARGWFAKQAKKELVAVENLDLSIAVGEKVAFIGPNGAGKSTTLKVLSGLLCPTEGQVQVCGLVPWEETRTLSRRIGLVFGQRSALWQALSIQDNFDLLAKIYDLDALAYHQQRERLVEMFGLQKLLPRLAQTLSLGQRMRCDIAAALLHRPDVLFLDEPTIGLDVTAKALLRDHLNLLAREQDTTILLTSHDTDDIEKICRRVVLIDHGKKVIDTSLTELRREYQQYKILRLVTEEEEPVFEDPDVVVEGRDPCQLVLKVDVARTSVEKVIIQCFERFSVQDIAIEGMPLEEIIKSIYARRKKKG